MRDRRRAIAVVAALTASVALTSAPAAFAVDGDPIASSTFTFKLSGKFKKQLKKNHVKMKPKALKLTKGDVDPTTGAGDLRFGKVTFKKGSKKVVYKNLKGSMPGTISDASSGKLFKLTAPAVTRNGFGADLSGVKVKFLKGAAKKLNKKLGLHSLKKGTAGSFNLSYQPETVKVLSGQADVAPSLASGSVALKLSSHCIPLVGGVTPIAPATQTSPPAGPFHFPVAGGTIAPNGAGGVVNQQGGLKLVNSQAVSPACSTTELHSLIQQNLSTLLASNQIQADVIISIPPAPPLGGPKGVAFAANIDPAGPPPVTVTADAAAHKITVSGGIIKITDTSALFLNQVFPQPASSFNANNEFKGGDLFGTPTMTVTTR
jgi:hypothetical protein